MLQLKPTELAAEARAPIIGMLLTVLTLGCGPRLPVSDGADEQATPDLPPPPDDVPPELTEYEGIVVGVDYHAYPSHFYACETGELWEMTYDFADPGWRVEGSCRGVFKRLLGVLDRSVDPPVLIIEDTLEARWSEPGECVVERMPEYDSCYQENEIHPCDPLDEEHDLCNPLARCNPARFWATERAGWMETRCELLLGDGQAGEPCEYPEDPGDVDTCAHGLRCWNPEGEMTQPGICVPYCDPAGDVGPACAGTCVQCSGDNRGLCVQGCSGDACNVDAFC